MMIAGACGGYMYEMLFFRVTFNDAVCFVEISTISDLLSLKVLPP